MGNNSSANQTRLFRPEDFSNDPSAFRVFVKKRNKFIPGWLKINDDEIVFSRGGNNFQYWSLAHLRRYGYTCSGVFFFESGRRCATGEGLHTFQSHQAERIFHMVQSKIKIEEYARGSRAGSVASGRVNSLVPNPAATSRIHPVQRFSSEGANNEFSPHHNGSLAPPPYNVIQDARRAQQNPSPNCPSVISSVSAYARSAPIFNNRERPRSVVSNMENNVIGAANLALHQPNPARHIHNSIQGNASSSTLLQHVLQQQHQGYALPHHLNSLTASASGSCLMNQSYHSALDSGSPWASQQQLDGDIVMEHVLGDENRRRMAMRPPEPIRMAVPPPRTFNGRQPGGGPGFGSGSGENNQQHAYVNVELRGQQQMSGQQQQNGLNVRELHRTDRSRLEFLSTGPGAFQLPYPNNGPPPHTSPVYYPLPGSAFMPTSSSSSMQHSFHQFYSPSPLPHLNSPYQHQQFQHHVPPPPLHPHHPAAMMPNLLMSQSMSGALPGSAGNGKSICGNVAGHPSPPSSLLYTSNSLERIMPNTGNGGMPMVNYALIEMTDKNGGIGGGGRMEANNVGGGSNSTLITSSTNTMATNATGS